MKRLAFYFLFGTLGTLFLWGCEDDNDGPGAEPLVENYSSADYPDLVEFTKSSNSEAGLVYEVLPGPAALNPEMNPTPFSNHINETSGTYSFEVSDVDAEDSESSEDAVMNVNIQFAGNDGTQYLIDEIRVIHKPAGADDHTFFGGVGLNIVNYFTNRTNENHSFSSEKISSIRSPVMAANSKIWRWVNLCEFSV